MTDTGGPLNPLYGQSRASDPDESVHVMSLIREHDLQTPDELYNEITRHHEQNCSCGIEAGGTVEDFGEWLYEAQADEWGEQRFSLEECRRWIYDLFITQSLKGRDLEAEARTLFEESFDVVEPTDEGDNTYRVDLIIEHDDDPIAGVQVKPESYRHVRDDVHNRNKEAHAEIDEPVYYLWYDYDREVFTNAERVMSDLYEHVGDDGR